MLKYKLLMIFMIDRFIYIYIYIYIYKYVYVCGHWELEIIMLKYKLLMIFMIDRFVYIYISMFMCVDIGGWESLCGSTSC